jgi:hypothetical protein
MKGAEMQAAKLVSAPEVLPPEACDFSAFVAERGRPPFLGDQPAPWHYRGWLLWYVLLAQETHPDVPDRWGYWARTMQAGRLLDEPIPRVEFSDSADAAVTRDLEKWIGILDEKFGSWSSLYRLLDWLAWGLAVSQEDPDLSEDVSEKLYRAVDIGPMLLHPHDYLGNCLAELKSGGHGKWKNPSGFYPTPHCVVECMVRMTMADSKGQDMRRASVCDPCVGTGRMLLHASNYSLNLWGMDIDPVVTRACLINGALYAPWLVRPFPPSILERTPIALPPPAPLPVPPEYTPVDGAPVFRCDDLGRGLLPFMLDE